MALDLLNARVRELVRERRIDPRSDATAVRQAAHDAVTEHENLSLTGRVRSLDEPEVVVGQLVADLVGFGPLQPGGHLVSVPQVRTARAWGRAGR